MTDITFYIIASLALAGVYGGLALAIELGNRISKIPRVSRWIEKEQQKIWDNNDF